MGSEGQWFTRPLIRRRYGCSYGAITWSVRELERVGAIERKRIEGRPAEPHWTRADRAEAGPWPGAIKMRSKARHAFRVTLAGLDLLERLRAGEQDILGRARSGYYTALRAWMPGRGTIHRRVIQARLGRPSWDAIGWCWANYGNPRPLGGGRWVWQEWTVEELFG